MARSNVVAINAAGPVDEHDVSELQLWIGNDEPLYRQSESIRKNLYIKMASGKYSSKLAPKLWRYVVDRAARSHPGPKSEWPMSGASRQRAAEEMARDFERAVAGGEYDDREDWVPKKYRPFRGSDYMKGKKNPSGYSALTYADASGYLAEGIAPNPRGVVRGQLARSVGSARKRQRNARRGKGRARNPDRKVTNIEVFDYGIDGSQYFRGHGAGNKRFAATGIGENMAEAVDDALEQLAQDGFDADDAERQAKRTVKVRTWPKKPSVASWIKQQGGDEEAAEDTFYYVGLRWD